MLQAQAQAEDNADADAGGKAGQGAGTETRHTATTNAKLEKKLELMFARKLKLEAQLGLSFVIAPPWADQASNPCSKNSWQLVYWPPTKLCYQIFSR